MAKSICSIEGCERDVYARGWCRIHYVRWRMHGDPNTVIRTRFRGTSEDLFWAKVDKSDECWLWTGVLDRKGYGKFGRDGKTKQSHRYAYELLVGPIPEGLELDHLCRNPPCCNPSHLQPVTHQENILRGISPAAQQARQTHCKRGHEFTPENTYRGNDGKRKCKTCHRKSARERYRNRKNQR